ncbi:uncharacterized protein EV420DRAFT_1490146 [Desarmillaria tabescens]|uniref:F-box domain-containing protein n=1 Tax=Armillaria tabescens TaxID=1929756 RepID=A0AA39MG26_ARMTA|nr:uncharacterized protein EV420DRAFT_1490146 [Desarmillaria tabescens]KAK0432200.1 hypothetical protein EV420DRAFT_1490146 [Desarmillaria tabescens]
MDPPQLPFNVVAQIMSLSILTNANLYRCLTVCTEWSGAGALFSYSDITSLTVISPSFLTADVPGHVSYGPPRLVGSITMTRATLRDMMELFACLPPRMIVFETVELDVVSADNWELHGARIVVPTLGSAVKRLLIHAVETFPPVPMFIDLSNLVSLEWFAFMSGKISPTSALNMLHSIPVHAPLRRVTLAVATFIDPTWGCIPTSLVRFRWKIQMCIAYRALPANRDVINTSSLVNVSYGTYAEVWDYILTGVHAQWIHIHVCAMSNWNDSSKKCTSLKLTPWGFVEASWLYPTNYVFARCAHTNNLHNKMLGYDEFEKSLYRETLICAIVHSEASWVPHMVRKPFQIMVYTTVQRFSDEASGRGPGGETKERATSRVWVKVELDVEEIIVGVHHSIAASYRSRHPPTYRTPVLPDTHPLPPTLPTGHTMHRGVL